MTILFFGCLSAIAQAPGYQPPKILTPSPTVAALMKFEETPVNNYTGIPDISIPLYSVGTHSKEINIDLSLRYHPSSVAVEEEASYVGLGWSFFCGGTISRTVRGMPDENFGGRFGINDGVNNPYFTAISYIGQTPLSPEDDILPGYLWDVQVNGKYDSEHDLYQFNFMGHSGRFILVNTCSLSSPCYEIKKLDNDNALRIDFLPGNRTFRIYDEKGFRFDFDVKETSTSNSYTHLIPFVGQDTSVPAPEENYTSAFHLSRIYNPMDVLLVEFKYNINNETQQPFEIIEASSNGSIITRILPTVNSDIQAINYICSTTDAGKVLQPRVTVSHNGLITRTKKLTRINVIDFATIDFTLETGRQDKNNLNTHRLKSITVKNKRGQQIKKIDLFHDYSPIVFNPSNPSAGFTNKRMMLTKVSETYGDKTLSYEMDYLKRRDELDMIPFFKDYWGYTTTKPDYEPNGVFKETHPFFCKMDILQKMKLPTGGAVVYKFEPNTYSYIGALPITDFSKNPFNWVTDFDTFFRKPGTGGTDNNLKYFDYDVNVVFVDNGVLGTLYKETNGVWTEQTDYGAGDYVLEGGHHYKIRIPNWQGQGQGAYMRVNYFYKRDPEYKFLLGGGVRIAKIGYFDNGLVSPLHYDADENPVYYENASYNDFPPQKEKNYNYHFANDHLRSSGSLVFAKPIYDYTETTQGRISCAVGGDVGINVVETVKDYTYQSTTDYNNLRAIKTHGADVGYQNVQVSETGNGHSQYVYKSPIDVPEDSYDFGPPFLPTSNRDNERGVLLKEIHLNQNQDTISKVVNFYNPIAGTLMTGLHAFVTKDCPFVGKYNGSYLGYKGSMSDCDNQPSDPNKIVECLACVKGPNYIGLLRANEAYAWMQLTEKITTHYFYEGLTSRAVTTKENFTYNPDNKQVATYETTNSGSGESIRKEYAYYAGPDNQISDLTRIKSYAEGLFAGLDVIERGTTGNSANLPIKIRREKKEVSDASADIAQEIISYDPYGNITTMTDGPALGDLKTYIWGYNNTLPIAVIEGARYDDLIANPTIAGLIDAAQQQSNKGNSLLYLFTPLDTLEGDLRTALIALRNALPQYRVTSFTHRPLIGITSVMDQRDNRTYYEYDEFNRLSAVYDKEKKLLSENKYNYKNQQ